MDQPRDRGESREVWRSAITEVRPNELRTHGIDQRTMIREFSFEETVFFVIQGRRPTEVERSMLRAVLVSTHGHGITGQSALAVIAAADCPSDFLHALVAGFSVGAGSVHLGATAAAMEELVRLAPLNDADLEREVTERLARHERFSGFGHRFHADDPRAQTILELVDEQGFAGRYLTLARRLETMLRARKRVALNIAGANAAILLDLGFDPRIAPLFIVLGRSAMFAAIYLERLAQARPPFPRIEVADV